MKASLQPKPMYCSRDYYYSSRVKRILTKQKIDRQLAGQSSSMPFMNMKDWCINNVTFDTQDGLEEKIDKVILMISKLTTQEDSQSKQFKPKIYQNRRRGQTRNIYVRHNYDQRNYQNRYRSDSGHRRISVSDRIQYGQNYRDSSRFSQINRNDFRNGNFKGNMRSNQNIDQNYRGGYRRNYLK